MRIVNNRFWRLEPAQSANPGSIADSAVLTSPAELISKLRRLDGIVIATWEPDTGQGRVHALGIVREVDDGRSAVVDWRRAGFTLRPTGSGATKWRTMPFFKFVDLVATRYGLMDYFQDAFAARSGATGTLQPPVFEPTTPVAAVRTSQGAQPEPGITDLAESYVPQRNRVTPSGDIFSTRERGMFMGNRTSPPRWLICDLHFKRDLKEPRKYTKLFFLDEAVALAAGHRPCNACRRDRYRAYLTAAKTDIGVGGAAKLDALLDATRRVCRVRSPIASLPDGAYVAIGEGNYWLKWSGGLHRWTPAGYVDPARPEDLQIAEATVLTPEVSLAALRNGYAPVVHASATER